MQRLANKTSMTERPPRAFKLASFFNLNVVSIIARSSETGKVSLVYESAIRLLEHRRRRCYSHEFRGASRGRPIHAAIARLTQHT